MGGSAIAINLIPVHRAKPDCIVASSEHLLNPTHAGAVNNFIATVASSPTAALKSTRVATAEMFPRITNSRGLGVGGPPAAHQVEGRELAVQIEGPTTRMPKPTAQLTHQTPLAAQTILPLTIAYGSNDEGKGLCSSLSEAQVALLHDVIGERVAVVRCAGAAADD